MSESVDIIKLDNDSIIISIRYVNRQEVSTWKIQWATRTSIKLIQDKIVIYNDTKVNTFHTHDIIIPDD